MKVSIRKWLCLMGEIITIITDITKITDGDGGGADGAEGVIMLFKFLMW